MQFQLTSALNPGIADPTDLLRVELLPFLVIQFFIERFDELGVHKIEESIAHVALVLMSSHLTLKSMGK